MELKERKKDRIIFKAEIEDSLANAIRRYISEIPVLAVDELEIIKNDSPLYDETIAHRVGLIPLKMDKTFSRDREIILKLSVGQEGIVYSGELEGGARVAFDKIPITILNKDQELEFLAKARIGKGSEHSKFLPGLMFYRHSSEIILGKELLKEIAKYFPDIKFIDKGNNILIVDDGEKEITDVIEGIASKNKKEIEINLRKELIITVESFGQLEVKDIFKNSIEQLKKDLEEVAKAV